MRAPVDRTEIRRLAADPEVIQTIKVIDDFFNKLYAETLRACPEELAGKTAEERIDEYWMMLKHGTLRLYDPEVDEGDVTIREAVTPGQRERARHVGAKLFAVRQHIKRQGREAARRR